MNILSKIQAKRIEKVYKRHLSEYVGKNALRQLPPDVTLEITEPDALPTFAASKWNRIMPLTKE